MSTAIVGFALGAVFAGSALGMLWLNRTENHRLLLALWWIHVFAARDSHPEAAAVDLAIDDLLDWHASSKANREAVEALLAEIHRREDNQRQGLTPGGDIMWQIAVGGEPWARE